MPALAAALFGAGMVAALIGCGEQPGAAEQPAGRGSPTCRHWQSALCQWASDCNRQPSSSCLDKAQGVQCSSDEQAETCAEVLDAAECSNVPFGCDTADLANREPAVQACSDLVRVTCERGETCQPGSYDACVASGWASLNCSGAIGFKLRYDQCLSELAALNCGARAPAACTGVIVLAE